MPTCWAPCLYPEDSLSAWCLIFVLFFVVGETLIFVGAFAAVTQGLHWRATVLSVALVLMLEPLWLAVSEYSSIFRREGIAASVALLVLLLVSVVWAVVQMVLFAPQKE